MGNNYTVQVDMPDAKQIMEQIGLGPRKEAQVFFANELARISDRYVPMRAGVLKNSVTVAKDGSYLEYNTPYARYHYYGKLAVDPKTGKGAMVFTDPTTGNVVFFSRPGVKKVITDKDMKYHEAPIRGPRWVERAYIDNKASLIKSLQKFIDERL